MRFTSVLAAGCMLAAGCSERPADVPANRTGSPATSSIESSSPTGQDAPQVPGTAAAETGQTISSQQPASQSAAALDQAKPLEIGMEVKGFELTDVMNNKPVKLSDYKGKVIVLVWYSPTCSACPAYLDRIRNFVARYAAAGDGDQEESGGQGRLVFLAVSSNSTDTPADLRDHAEMEQFQFPLLRDGDAAVAGYFNIEQTCTFVLIDDKGVLRYRGGFDDSLLTASVKKHYLEEAVEAVLAHKDVPTAETVSWG